MKLLKGALRLGKGPQPMATMQAPLIINIHKLKSPIIRRKAALEGFDSDSALLQAAVAIVQ